jgi:hypothetical protein
MFGSTAQPPHVGQDGKEQDAEDRLIEKLYP